MGAELFSKGKIKIVTDKEKINTTPDTKVPNDDTPNTVVQDVGYTDSNSPYLFRNCNFAPYSTNTTKK